MIVELDRLLGIGAVEADEVVVGAEGLLLEPRVGAVAVRVDAEAGARRERGVGEAVVSGLAAQPHTLRIRVAQRLGGLVLAVLLGYLQRGLALLVV